MKPSIPRFLSIMLAAACVTSLTACATTVDRTYPSLARRAVELRGQVPANRPVVDAPPAVVTAELGAAISALQSDAARGQAAFAAALPGVEARVQTARGAAAGSEPWFIAQAALSVLDNARAPSTLALAELDRLVVVATLGSDVRQSDILVENQTTIAELVNAQSATIEAMIRSLAAAP